MPYLKRRREVLVWGAYALALFGLPLLAPSSFGLTLLAQIGIAIIACLSFNILLGQGGLLSFGHAVYSGMGAFFAMHTLNAIGLGFALPISLIPLVAGVGSAALALPLGWVSTRKAGNAFAMITFGLGELVWAGALMFPGFFGGEAGVSGDRMTGSTTFGINFGPQIQLVYLIAVYTLICTFLMFAFTHTPLGRLLNAVRDNAERVAFIGYDPHRVRWQAFVVAAFFAGVAGGLAALNFELVTADVLSAQRSGSYLLFTVLGGSGYFVGPIIGAVMMVLSFVLLSALTPAWLLYVGLMFVGVVLYAPGGFASLVLERGRWILASGAWRALGLAYLSVCFAAGAAIAGFAALIEMVYRLQMEVALGPRVSFFGVQLDVLRPGAWVGAGVLMLVGLAALAWSHRHWVRRRQRWLDYVRSSGLYRSIGSHEASGS